MDAFFVGFPGYALLASNVDGYRCGSQGGGGGRGGWHAPSHTVRNMYPVHQLCPAPTCQNARLVILVCGFFFSTSLFFSGAGRRHTPCPKTRAAITVLCFSRRRFFFMGTGGRAGPALRTAQPCPSACPDSRPCREREGS